MSEVLVRFPLDDAHTQWVVVAGKTRHDLTHLNSRLDRLLAAADDEDNLGTQSLRALLLEDTEGKGVTNLELVGRALIARAAAGDVKAIALVYDRAFGRSSESKQTQEHVHKIALAVTQLAPLAAKYAAASATRPRLVQDSDHDRGNTDTTPEIGCTPLEPHLPHPRSDGSHNSSPAENIIDAEFTS